MPREDGEKRVNLVQPKAHLDSFLLRFPNLTAKLCIEALEERGRVPDGKIEQHPNLAMRHR